ncbi:MAG: alpha/beta hydrolase [Flavobacterium sp.]|nr:MAG: alpha/beta hydrolase [Flavobacterium sp.]
MKIYFAAALLLLSIAATAQSTASKQLSTITLNAPQLGGERRVWIYLPKSYEDSPTKRYPVIYMHDGQNLFDKSTSFVGEWNIDEKLDSLNAQVIAIGIDNGGEKRIDELTPFPNVKYGGGKADNYLDFIINVVKPEIDRTYRTKPDAKHTAIMGSSLGGLVSFYAILKYPDVFGKAAVFSPSFWFSDEIFKFAKSAPKIKSKIYFLAGDSEDEAMVNDLNKMELIIHENRCACLKLDKKVIVKGGHHNEKLWRDSFVKAYLWLF